MCIRDRGGGGTTLSHGGSGGASYNVPGPGAPVSSMTSGAPLEMFDMAGGGFVANGYVHGTIGGVVYYWPSWTT